MRPKAPLNLPVQIAKNTLQRFKTIDVYTIINLKKNAFTFLSCLIVGCQVFLF